MLSRSGARRYWWIWVAVVPIAAWTVVRIFGLERGYPLVPMMAFTPYAAIAALLVAGVATALRNWSAAAVAALATLCLAIVVLPRAIGSSAARAAGHETFTVLAANVHRGTADPAALLALVDRYDPDVLSVEELTPSFVSRLRRSGIAARLPNAMLLAAPGASGAGLYSRLPLEPLHPRARLTSRMPWARVLLPDGRRLRVVSVHPYAPVSGEIGTWKAELESLPPAVGATPWVLAGDFNATLDQAELRDVIDGGYHDAGDVTGKGLEPTWPTMGHRFMPPSVTIDHVLADRRLGIADYGVDDLSGSDHRTIHAEIVLP